MRINIPQRKKQDIINAFCIVYNYQAKVLDKKGNMIANPQSKAKFAKNELLKFVRNVYNSSKITETKATRQIVARNSKIYTNDLTVT